jgi:hypothetical protein
VWEKIVWSRKCNYLRVKRCRRRISAVCVRKDNHWSVVKNSLVSTTLACLLSVVIKCWVESAGSGPETGKRKGWGFKGVEDCVVGGG